MIRRVQRPGNRAYSEPSYSTPGSVGRERGILCVVSEFAQIAVPLAVQGSFTYSIPTRLRDDVRLGSRVEVPFGAKRVTGFVVALSNHSDTTKLKPIHAVLDDDEPALLPEIIHLCRWAAEYYIAPLGEMLRVALPANMAARGKREIVVVDGPSVPLNKALRVFTRTSIDKLRDAGVIVVRDQLRDAAGVRYDRFAILESDPGDLPEKQRQAVDLLRARGGEASVKALSPSTLSTLARKNIIRIERRPRRHTLDSFLTGLDTASVGDIRYSHEQQNAIDAIKGALGTFAPFLLEGV